MKATVDDSGDLVFKDSMTGTYFFALVIVSVGFFGAIYSVFDKSKFNESNAIGLLISMIALPLLSYGFHRKVGSYCKFRTFDKVFCYEINEYFKTIKGEIPIQDIEELFVDDKLEGENLEFNEKYRFFIKNGKETIPLYLKYLDQDEHQIISEKISNWFKSNNLSLLIY